MTDHDKLREAIKLARSGTTTLVRDAFGKAPAAESIFLPTAIAQMLADAAESTLPKTKMVEVWRVEYASNGIPDVITKTSRDAADIWVNGAKSLAFIACIRVTGPHQQEVPE